MRPRQRRARIIRALRIRIAIALYVLRRLGPPIIGVVVYITVATLLLRWDYRRSGADVPAFGPTMYSIFRQLFFEPAEAFPATVVGRAIVLLTPIMSVVLIAQGLLKIGSSFLDPQSRREVWTTIMSDLMRGHIVVCGLGHVGYRVVEELRALGEDIVAIEQNEKDEFVDTVRQLGIPVIIGDARRDDLLLSAGVARAKAVVCATDNDLANLEIALDAKQMNPEVRVVMRMFDQRVAGKVGGALALDQSFSTSSLSAPLIAMQATHAGVRSAYRLDDSVRVTAEVKVSADAAEAKVAEIEERSPCRVVSLRRGAEGPFVAVKPSDNVRGGDVLVVDTAAVDLPAVRFQLGGK